MDTAVAQPMISDLPEVFEKLRSAFPHQQISSIKSNLRNTIQAWADRVPKPSPSDARRRPRTLPGAWRMRKSAPAHPAGSSLAINPLKKCGFAAIIPGDSAVEMVVTSTIYNFLNIYNTIIICRLVLTWFPNPPQQIVGPLATMCDPYLNLFRGIIPPLGGLDLSPILAFVVLNTFTSTAAALPCEMPVNGQNPRLRRGPSEAATKWAKRMEMTARRKMGLPIMETPAQE